MADENTMVSPDGKLTRALAEEAAAKYVIDAKEHFKTQRKNAGYERLWQDIDDSYFNKSSDYYQGKAGVKDAQNFKIVERAVTKLKKIFFPPDEDWFNTVAKDEDNGVQVAQAVESKTLLDEQTNDMNIKTKYTQNFRDLTTYGTVWSKVFWEHRVREVFKRNSDNERVKDYETEYDNPNSYSPEIWDVYADIRDENLEGIVIERVVKDFQELWENREHEDEDGEKEGIFKNVDKLRMFKNPRPVKDSEKKHSETLRGLGEHVFGSHEKKITVLECWGPIPKWFLTLSTEDKRNMTTVEGMIVVAVDNDDPKDAKGVTLLIADNPFDHQRKPYDRARYIAINGRLYGIGAIEHNLTMERGANTILNQALDTHTFNLRPKWLMDEQADIDPAALKDLDEQIIETQDVNGLQALRPDDFTTTSLAIIQFFKATGEENTGATPITGGVAQGSSIERTTTGVVTTTSNALDRFELVAENFADELARPQLRKIWALDQQFLPKGRAIMLNGKGLKRVKPRKIAMPTIRFEAISNQIQKELRINQANILTQNVSSVAQFGLDPVPFVLEQIKLMGWKHIIPQVDKRPDSDERLEQTPEGEVLLLRLGKKVRIDFDDDHDQFIAAYETLLQETDLPTNVRVNTEKALGERIAAKAMRDNPSEFAKLIRRKPINDQPT